MDQDLNTTMGRVEFAIACAQAVADCETAPIAARLRAAAAAARWDALYIHTGIEAVHGLQSDDGERAHSFIFSDGAYVGEFERIFLVPGWNEDDAVPYKNFWGDREYAPSASYLEELVAGADASDWTPRG
jgi:hypothetical protein